MFPVALGALVTRLTAVARSAGPTLTTAAARIRSMGFTVGDKVDDIVAWVKANPMNASLMGLTLASLGVEMSDVFESDVGKAAAKRLQVGASGLVAEAKILEAGRSSEKLNLQVAEVASDAHTAIEILRFARSEYGSARNAVKAHRLHQAFFEMPLDDVIAGYDTLAV